nr:hypothetical protein [Tanacetum cinerariifolium]
MISYTSESKPLALPLRRTPRLDFGVRVKEHVVRNVLRKWPAGQSASVLLHPGRGQYDAGISSDPLCLLFVQLGRGPDVMLTSVITFSLPSILPLHLLNGVTYAHPTKFLVDVLEYFQINLSQLSVMRPLRSLTSRSYVAFIVLFQPPLDSLKHWNDHFLWVDAFVFPLVVSWHSNKTLRKDPYLTPAEFNANVCNYLTANPSPFRKFLEHLLCFVGISRYYDLDDNCYPTFLIDDDEEMDLFAFIHHTDPTKVWIGERENEVVLDVGNQNDDAQDAGNNLIGGEDHGIFGDVGASIGGKSLAAIQKLFEQSTLNVEVGVTTATTVPFVTSYVAPLPEREGGRHTDSVYGPYVRTRHPAERFVISSDSSHHSSTNVADDEVTFIVRSSVPPPPLMATATATTVVADTSSFLVPRAGEVPVHASIFADSTSAGTVGPDIVGPSQPAGTELSADTFYVSQDMDSEMLHQIYVPKWNVVNESALVDPDVCHSLVDQLAPRVLFSQLCSMEYEHLFAEFNVGATRQTCLGAEERDAEVASLKEQLSFKEAEAAKVIRLRETTCFELHDEVSGYKLFKEQIEAVQDEQVKILSDKVAEYLAALGGSIGRATDKGMQDGLAAGIDHGKARRSLIDVAAYNPIAKANYVSALNTLCAVDFPLLSQLLSYKDASMFDIMGLLCLEGPAAETLEVNQLQPSLEQLILLIHCPEDQVVIREPSLSFSLDVIHSRVQRIRGDAAVSATATATALSTTFIQTRAVPLISVADYEVLGVGPSIEVPYPQRLCLRRRSWILRRSILRPLKPGAFLL